MTALFSWTLLLSMAAALPTEAFDRLSPVEPECSPLTAESGNLDSLSIPNAGGRQRFRPPQQLNGIVPSPSVGAVADVNGDGRPDLFAVDKSDEVVWWQAPETMDGLWQRHVIQSLSLFSDYHLIAPGDIDGDGDIDLVSTVDTFYYADDETVYWENVDGKGTTWAEHQLGNSADSPSSISIVDLDLDGDPDLLTSGDHGISWFENTVGDGSVWIRHDIPGIFGRKTWVTAGDLDGDGDLDLVSAAFGNSLSGWNSNGAQEWREHAIVGSPEGNTVLRVADYNLDGDQDILWLNTTGDQTVGLLDNRLGDGTAWSLLEIDTAERFNFGLLVADLDGDGDPDMVAGDSDTEQIIVWRNEAARGSQAWVRHEVTQVRQPDLIEVIVGDIDADGDMDIIGSWIEDGEVGWWENPLASKCVSAR